MNSRTEAALFQVRGLSTAASTSAPAPPEQEVPLLLEDATFFDDMQMMILRVARCTDDSLTVTAAVRYYCLIFDGGLVRYESIWTE